MENKVQLKMTIDVTFDIDVEKWDEMLENPNNSIGAMDLYREGYLVVSRLSARDVILEGEDGQQTVDVSDEDLMEVLFEE